MYRRAWKLAPGAQRANNARVLLRGLVPLFPLALVAACGGQTHHADADGGSSSAGGSSSDAGSRSVGGAPTSSSAGNGAALGPTSQCILDQAGPPAPRIEILHPPPLMVMCGGSVEADLIHVGNDAGRGFDWTSRMLGSDPVFSPSIPDSSACAGFGFTSAGVYVRFPALAAPGQTATGTLQVTTTYAALGEIEAQVSAVLVASQFTLDSTSVEFGSTPVGQGVLVRVTVHNLGLAPLEVLGPTAPLQAPFRYIDWGVHGEDPPPLQPIPPGDSAEIKFWFYPTAPGDFSAEVELSPSNGDLPAACGSAQTLTLHGTATPP